jgi:hypothetical protein
MQPFNDFADDRKTNPDSVGVRRRECLKCSENLFVISLRNADAVVPDHKQHRIFVGERADLQMKSFSWFAKLNSILNQFPQTVLTSDASPKAEPRSSVTCTEAFAARNSV